MQTNRNNINPSRVDDKRTNFLTVRLVAAANSAHPTKYAQNKVRRHPGRDHIRDSHRAAEMLGREYSEWNGDEDTAQGDELIPAASRADLFSKYKNSGDKQDR
jgi:hypothetical protein